MNKSSKVNENQGVLYHDNSRWDHADWGDDSDDDTYVEEFKKLLFPDFHSRNQKDSGYKNRQRRDFRDCMHLSTHKIYGREYFLTDNKDFLRKKDELYKRYKIKVIKPEDFVILIKSKHDSD